MKRMCGSHKISRPGSALASSVAGAVPLMSGPWRGALLPSGGLSSSSANFQKGAAVLEAIAQLRQWPLKATKRRAPHAVPPPAAPPEPWSSAKLTKLRQTEPLLSRMQCFVKPTSTPPPAAGMCRASRFVPTEEFVAATNHETMFRCSRFSGSRYWARLQG
jgi:hypothetical protein